ncbi:hypothetical protein Vretimale_8269 [Volvox reticuliferus]|uniref:Uncharacterized protein n=1 Tax=Volvox reticuliferus TaxID=1737510 RepID=A0A8J4CGR0_9CHLO|nr:hypothetical protein Vretifemale_11591 [Volvox reticuliferus]GIM03505.1 hypothetical protein Vretimale_8269 [Volvox reticuliferus]
MMHYGMQRYIGFIRSASSLQMLPWNDILRVFIQAAFAVASSPEPEYALNLKVETDGIRSAPQLLIDVLYADNSNRPLPFEVRHLLTSRPAVAKADREVADAVQELTSALQSHPASAQLVYDDNRMQLTVIPASNASSVPGASRQYQRLHRSAARVSSSLASMRKVAPGLRLLVTVVPSPAPGARTFSWRLLQQPDTQASAMSMGATNIAKQVASPLRVASAYGAAAIVEAVATVAQQAAAIAAAVTTVGAPLIQLQLEAGRRLVAITSAINLMETAPTSAPQRSALSNNAILRTLSLTRGADQSGGSTAATASTGIATAARADEAAAVLRRAISSANHALFRLAKCSTAGASSGRDAAALRKGDRSAYPISKAVTLVLEAAIFAIRQVAGVTAAEESTASKAAAIRSSADGGMDGALPINDLISVEPQLCVISESGSVLSSSVQGGGSSGCGGAGSTVTSFPIIGAPISPLPPKGCGSATGADGLIPGWSWSWEWGIEPRVTGVSFPECLPPKARAVHEAVNRAVDAARNIMEQLPLVQRDVLALVGDFGTVFQENDEQLATAARDMMSAGRMRSALDRNANTISASPALVGRLQASVRRLMDDLRRGAEQMRRMANDWADGVDADMCNGREACDSSSRGSGNRSIMVRQLNKSVAMAAAAAAAAAADEEAEEADVGSEQGSGMGSESGSNDAGGVGGDSSVDGGDRGYSSGGGDKNTGADGKDAVQTTRRDSGSGAASATGYGPDGDIKSAIRTGSMGHASAVSRRVMLPPLQQGT